MDGWMCLVVGMTKTDLRAELYLASELGALSIYASARVCVCTSDSSSSLPGWNAVAGKAGRDLDGSHDP